MNLRYTLGAILSVPLLPILAQQGKRIRSSVPTLPEATGTTGMAHSPQQEARTLRLLTIGESTIAGVGVATHAEGYTGTLAQELADTLGLHVNWRVYARSGYTAKRVTYKIIPKIEETEADLIVLGLGGNDAFTLNRPKKWKQELRDLIDAIRERFPEAPIVFCNMPPIKEFPAFTPLIKFIVGNLVEILGEELQDLVHSLENVFYVNEIITVKEWVQRFRISAPPSAFFSDGVHPSPLTYQTWARDTASHIAANEQIWSRWRKGGIISDESKMAGM